MNIPEGYLSLLQKIEKNLNEDDLKLLQEIGKGNLPHKDVIKKLRIRKLLDLRKVCREKLELSIKYMDMPCVFYYVRIIKYLDVLICKRGYKNGKT